MKSHLQIEIVSDVVCPWCALGYHGLREALKQLAPEVTADIAWRPFELNSDMEPEGEDLMLHLQDKYGASAADLRNSQQQIAARGKPLGFEFNFREGGRIYNTFDAHRLLHWAKQYSKQTELKLALFRLYFTEGGNPSSPDDLLKAVQQAGLSQDEARDILQGDRYRDEVKAEEQRYLQMGVKAVPTFIFNQREMVVGGMPVPEFVELLKKMAAAA